MPAMDAAWISQLAGKFLVFEGPDGAGKTTQWRRFRDLVRENGVEVCEVREPGGTHIGEKIRDLLLDVANDEMVVRCEMLLYMASRAQLVSERIRPAMDRGELVLADRFISSTLAYQGTAGGMSMEDIRSVARIAVGSEWPDKVVVFDVDAQTAAHRVNPLLDRVEAKGSEYHSRVRDGYLKQVNDDPEGHILIDATADTAVVFERVCDSVARWLEGVES